MIDIAARREAAVLLKRFALGRLSGWEFEDALYELAWRDAAVAELEHDMYFSYDEMDEGECVAAWRLWPRESRRAIARWRLLLAADSHPFVRIPSRFECFLTLQNSRKVRAFFPFVNQEHLKRVEGAYLARC